MVLRSISLVQARLAAPAVAACLRVVPPPVKRMQRFLQPLRRAMRTWWGGGVRTWWLTGRCHRRPPLRARCSELGLSMTSMSLAGYERCSVHVCLCLCVGVPGDLRVHVGVAVCMCVWGTQPTSCCMQVLGRGNFGAVHLGVDKNTGEQVAIKVIRKPERATHRDEQVILNEIAILKKVRAPLLSKHQPGALSSHLSTAIYRLSQSWIART